MNDQQQPNQRPTQPGHQPTQLGQQPTQPQTFFDADWKECPICGSDVHIERWKLGYHYCKMCGDVLARDERESWCVVQEYGKGNYQYVSSTYARTTLRDTNQKNPRS